MGESVKKGLEKGKGFIAGLSKTVKALIIAVLLLAVAAIVVIFIYNANIPYSVLFTGLSSDDMSSILTYLDENNEDYQVQGTDTIMVRENRVNALQGKVLMQGLPTSGYLYSTYFDNVDSLSSDSDRTQAKLYELQDRLGAMIASIDGVKSAAVNISPASDSRYILSTEDKIDASAFIMLEMENGAELTQSQAAAIISGVSHSVAGLNFEEITLADQAGNQYTGEEDPTITATTSAELKLELEKQVNKRIRNSVLSVLSPMFGVDNVSVSVVSTVNVSEQYVEYTHYDQPEWAADGSTEGRGIINRYIWDDSVVRGDTEEGVGGVVGTTTNADLNEYITDPENLTGDEDELHAYGELYYDNDVTYTQTEIPAGQITDVQVAVSINSTTAVIPETVDLVSLVGRAAGIDAEVQDEKVQIVAYPFYEYEDEEEPGSTTVVDNGTFSLPTWLLIVMAVALALIIILIIVLISVRGKKKQQEEPEQPQEEYQEEYYPQEGYDEGYYPEEQYPEEGYQEYPDEYAAQEQYPEDGQGADIMDIHTEKSMELRRDVRQFAEENPEIAAQMIKNLLKGGDEQHA